MGIGFDQAIICMYIPVKLSNNFFFKKGGGLF